MFAKHSGENGSYSQFECLQNEVEKMVLLVSSSVCRTQWRKCIENSN